MKIGSLAGRAILMVAGLLAAQQAQAAGTAAGSTVTNSVTVNYSIGTSPQTATATAAFTVDRKIDVVVAEVGNTDTTVLPGATQQVTTFTVTNASNDTLDFGLSVGQPTTGTGPRGQNDTFNATSVAIYRESDGTAGFSATDALVTYLDGLVPTSTADPTLGIQTVYVVATIPGTVVNNDLAVVTLTAQARDGSTNGTEGAILVETTGADTAGVDNVFADGDGPAADDGPARDGKHSDDDAYIASVTMISLEKARRLISDPINTTTNPKFIPGAVVEYCILAYNPGNNPVTGIAVDDPIPTNVTYVAGSIMSVPTATNTTDCFTAAGVVEDDNAVDGDDTDGFGAAYDTAATKVTATIPTLAATTRTALRFRVTIN